MADRGSRVGLRRSLVLVAMTVVLPGSAQRLAGNRRLGKIALRVWAALWLVVLGVAVLAVASPITVVGWATSGSLLQVVRVTLVLVAAAMAALLLDAWRIGRPFGLRRGHRLVAALTTGGLVAGVGGPLLIASSYVQAERHVLGTLFASHKVSAVANNRLNIMLVGGDAGADRTGLRPDSLSLVSINLSTGKPVVIGLPRNLENVPFPDGTRMHQLWPQGFNCGDQCLLNGIYTWAATNAAKFPGVPDPGLTATRQAVSAITGLKVNYYVMVDLASFKALVDDLGGITVRVDVPVPIGGETSPITSWIEPGLQHLDGYHALWLARSRSNSSDYARMARQRCVMQAMLTQIQPAKVILAFRALASAAATYTRTDIPASQLPLLAGLAEKARTQPLRKVDLIPPAVLPGDPDWARVRAVVSRALASTDPAPARSSSRATRGASAAPSHAPAATPAATPAAAGATSMTTPSAGSTPAASAAVDGSIPTAPVCSVPR